MRICTINPNTMTNSNDMYLLPMNFLNNKNDKNKVHEHASMVFYLYLLVYFFQYDHNHIHNRGELYTDKCETSQSIKSDSI